MAIIDKTKNSFIGVFLSLVIAPYDTYNLMINHEKSKFSIFTAFIFFTCLVFPEMLCIAFDKKPIYVEGFLEILTTVIALTFLFFVIFLKITLFIFKYKCSTYKIFKGSCYLFAYLTIALLISYALNYSLDYDYFRLAFIDGVNETPSAYYFGYFRLFIYVTILFTIANLISLMRALTQSSFSIGLCFSVICVFLLIGSLVFGITFADYILEDARNLFIQFIYAPKSLIVI